MHLRFFNAISHAICRDTKTMICLTVARSTLTRAIVHLKLETNANFRVYSFRRITTHPGPGSAANEQSSVEFNHRTVSVSLAAAHWGW